MKASAFKESEYSAQQLKDALATLASSSGNNPSERDDSCRHIFGYRQSTSEALSFFDETHVLSMLQTITARRILDYEALLVG